MSALLEIREASKAFGGVQAVTRVALEAQKGEILSVIGPNGAGKTTVLNMISGFYHPDTGRIALEGHDVTDLSPSRIAELGIARTFQNIALFRGMTVLDNLMLGRHVHMKTGVLGAFAYWGFAQKEEVEHRRRVEDIIDFLRIQDLRRRPTGSLAYGLQKRVGRWRWTRRSSFSTSRWAGATTRRKRTWRASSSTSTRSGASL